jgi:para-nitrobenzyl esterase
MNRTKLRRAPLLLVAAALTALILTAGPAVDIGVAGAAAGWHHPPIVRTENGAVRGVAAGAGYAFLGMPYAAPPTGNLRWRPPRPPIDWRGVRDATQFAPSCPQRLTVNAPPGPMSEDCLYLNVYTPGVGDRHGTGRPVLVWIHGGGLTLDGARNYDPTKLAADGTVVVTINYRLGALGFLAHPALASHPGGPAGNYGLMDQQTALRWVQRNIRQFDGDPHNVTIAGQSAGGLSVLAQLVSPQSGGLFQKAIVESGSFALTQQSLASAEAFGQSFATQVGCADQTAACLRNVPVDTLVNDFPPFAIPGVVDGHVLTQSIGAALAAGRFARVPILNGVNHDEERIFIVAQHVAVSGGTFVPVTQAVTDANYQQLIASTLGVSDARAGAIAQEYPTDAYASPTIAFSTLVSDANFACPALQIDKWTSRSVPTFAYQFNDDTAPPRYAVLDPPVATHGSELPYLFDLPNAPLQGPLNAAQQQLAATMQASWINFAATGNPTTHAAPWPAFNYSGRYLSLLSPVPHSDAGFAAQHHCSLWAAR